MSVLTFTRVEFFVLLVARVRYPVVKAMALLLHRFPIVGRSFLDNSWNGIPWRETIFHLVWKFLWVHFVSSNAQTNYGSHCSAIRDFTVTGCGFFSAVQGMVMLCNRRLSHYAHGKAFFIINTTLHATVEPYYESYCIALANLSCYSALILTQQGRCCFSWRDG